MKNIRLLLAPDSLFFKTPDGKYWCDTIYSYDFFQRYLDVFNSIIIASRCRDVSYTDVKGYLRSDGPNITVVEMPAMQGMNAYIKNIIAFSRTAKVACDNVDCAIIRLPSVSATMVLHYFKKKKKPYALEIVADPYEAYVENVLAKYFLTCHLKKSCFLANGVSYVTKDYLQRRYPSYARRKKSDDRHFESYYSTIRIRDNYFGVPREYNGKTHFKLIHTANNMNNDMKGHEVAIRALKKVLNEGYDVEITFVGDGSKRKKFEKLVSELQIVQRVTFTGMLSSSSLVRDELMKADLLIFPTKAEGLPRTVIEAMAVGLPCISTPVAGIPELLEPEDMLNPLDVDAFARRIIELISDTEVMNKKSKRNIIVAQEYREDVLKLRRDKFYTQLKKLVKE